MFNKFKNNLISNYNQASISNNLYTSNKEDITNIKYISVNQYEKLKLRTAQ